LEYPKTTTSNDAEDQATDVIQGDIAELQSLLTRSTPDEPEPTDSFEDGIMEVFGPPVRRPRIDLDDSPVPSPDLDGTVTQRQRQNSEEAALSSRSLDTTNHLRLQTDLTALEESNNFCVPTCTPASIPTTDAAIASADRQDDGPSL
jgi:hypothetical protein